MLAHPSNRNYDRFIPQRSHTKPYHQSSYFAMDGSGPDSAYSHLVKKQLFENIPGKIINFDDKVTEEFEFKSDASSSFFKQLNPNVESPVKILDIPKYRDDFYLNNIDWSSRGPLAIALDNEIFLYTPQRLLQLGQAHFGQYVSSLKIDDCVMAVGLSSGMIEIYDLERFNLVRRFKQHENRVSAFTFVDRQLVSGSKDKSILVHDLRSYNTITKKYNEHNGEVCSLKAKDYYGTVFASGSSDGSAIIWDLNYGKIDQFKGHKGAVKALDWCPWKSGILATGGGNSNQKYIKIWNTEKSKLVTSQPIQHQISGLLWNEELKMLSSSHGYTDHEVTFWTLESNNTSCRLKSQKSFKAHERRVLNMVQSHDKNYLCTVGADQSLKFWCLRSSEGDPFKNQKIEICSDKEKQYRV